MKYAILALIFGFTLNSQSFADCTHVRGLLGTPTSVCRTAWDQVATGKCYHYESYAAMWYAGVSTTPLANNEVLYTIYLDFNHDNVSYAVPMKIRYNEMTQKSEVEGYCCGYKQCVGNIK